MQHQIAHDRSYYCPMAIFQCLPKATREHGSNVIQQDALTRRCRTLPHLIIGRKFFAAEVDLMPEGGRKDEDLER